jgi:hypothetical protein
MSLVSLKNLILECTLLIICSKKIYINKTKSSNVYYIIFHLIISFQRSHCITIALSYSLMLLFKLNFITFSLVPLKYINLQNLQIPKTVAKVLKPFDCILSNI